jgi:hypothetical protein
MAQENFRDATLIRAATDLLSDLSDLVRKEFRLARAELAQKLNERLHAAIWIAVAGFLGLTAVLLLVEGIVFALASAGLALHWSCFLVAVALTAIAALAYYLGRSGLSGDLAPTRSARQFNEAVRTATEQLR